MSRRSLYGRADHKPVDVGDGRLVASLAVLRPALLSVTTYHPEHGVAELTGMPPFEENARGNPDEVRRYRRLLASDDFPCLWLEGTEGATEEARVEEGEIVLQWRPGALASRPARLRFAGRLDRPALAEITELHPPPPTGATTGLFADGPRLLVRSTLPAEMAIESSIGEWLVDGDEASLELGVAEEVSVRIRSLDDLPVARRRATGRGAASLRVPTGVAPLVDRALAYVRNCAALSTGPTEVAILADHRLLPLSWTRDAYYQALLLLATGEPADADLVADHLRWLWRRCERPNGRWLRSHHADGRPKDLAFQADQQLYPMIELADYWRARGDLPDGVDWATELPKAWAATMAEVHPETSLIATAENAADDPALAPYVCASQILLWYAALRVAELADARALGLDARALRATAAKCRASFDAELVEEGRWLYATDTRAMRVHYHDANDLPVALAPLLGFCAADDPAWLATMNFAFSMENTGYFGGERGGLGSIHTPMPWTLGDIQAWIHTRIRGDKEGVAAAIERLREVAFHDGMLPEAYSATRNPDQRIRHWFAWPGAAFSALLLLDSHDAFERLAVADGDLA